MIGSFFAASALGAFGMRRVYPAALALMAAGFGLASASPTIVLAAVLAAVATIGNGAAIVCNQVLVQRGAPDAMRGRALAVLMSTYYAILGLSMAAGGLLVDAVGARASWAIASGIFLVAAALAVVLTARLREADAPLPQSRAERARADQDADGRDRRHAPARASSGDRPRSPCSRRATPRSRSTP